MTGVGVAPRVVRSLRRTASKAPIGPPTTLAKSTFPTTEMSRPNAVSSVRSTVRMVASTRTCLGGVSSSSMSFAARATFSPKSFTMTFAANAKLSAPPSSTVASKPASTFPSATADPCSERTGLMKAMVSSAERNCRVKTRASRPRCASTSACVST